MSFQFWIFRLNAHLDSMCPNILVHRRNSSVSTGLSTEFGFAHEYMEYHLKKNLQLLAVHLWFWFQHLMNFNNLVLRND